MSDFLNPAIEELKDLILATWPEIADVSEGQRLWESEHLATIPFGDIPIPAAILVTDTAPWTEGPLSRHDVFIIAEIYYVDRAPGSPAGLRTKVQELRDALWPVDPLTLSQVWPEPWPTADCNLKLEINRLLRGKKLPLLAGVVRARLLTGEPE